ncbi:hypothetical protein MVEN_01853200 [Mycena venus]|uniref:Methyltransferase domain-containing protein n=1 Tax=Mycena venus TaxID=2733690 RepID=A0A8H6XIM3_9AGAR|nr:hypothetical protein MVEN_01853200 [Mycena venus]
MASLLSAGIMQRINQKALGQHWRWFALSAALLLGSTIYLLGRDTYPTVQYHELLATTHPNNYNCSSPITLGGTNRLARTLEGNERRYQYMLGERQKLIEKEGGSQIAVFPPPRGRYYVLWDFFIPAFSCPFPMYRVGQLSDGGKWVCGLERVLHHRPNCVVYSLNTQTPAYSSFEVDILEKSSGCQIYGFDAKPTPEAPSRWPWGEADDILRSRVHFNPFTIADPTAQLKYRSLRSVMRDLGHDWIDILKLDLEGSEFATLLAIIAENQGEPLPFWSTYSDSSDRVIRRYENGGTVPRLVHPARVRGPPTVLLRSQHDGCEQ